MLKLSFTLVCTGSYNSFVPNYHNFVGISPGEDDLLFFILYFSSFFAKNLFFSLDIFLLLLIECFILSIIFLYLHILIFFYFEIFVVKLFFHNKNIIVFFTFSKNYHISRFIYFISSVISYSHIFSNIFVAHIFVRLYLILGLMFLI